MRFAPANRLIASLADRTMQAVKLGIALKFFLAILLAAAVAAAAMAIATRVSFQSGFLGYLNQVDAQRLDELARRLAVEYRRNGDWTFLRDDYARLRALALPPPSIPRLALIDQDGRSVVGNPEIAQEGAVKPILVDGHTVGWIGRSPLRRLSTAAEVSFQQEQLRSAWVIAALALALAGGLALVLGRAFVTPVKRVADATHRLAAGDYATRVPVRTKDELGRLAADFNRLAATLERNETLRRRFMADVSHELRTPLAVLSAELEALEDGVRPLTAESLASLRGEVTALGKLVDDLNQLALSDVGALAYRKRRVDLRPLLEQALESYRDRFAARRLTAETALNDGAIVFGDADRLLAMFRNLLENCARYTDPGGRVRVSGRREDARVIVDFDDSAPGVPAEALPRLFERFYRVDASRNRANGGAGLGLAICRSIAAAHDGEIAAVASPLGGLRVRITLSFAA
ncbi:MAG: sensor histidine kinase efflux regulator BaeS [Burkholderiales bacterium]